MFLRGAAEAGEVATQVQVGLRDALGDGPLTILALGPLTNVAAALKGRFDLQANVVRIVAVMGRRPGHIFHPSEGEGEGMLFGHGPVFRDLNFDKDRDAATELIDMDLPISLVPYDVARGISVDGADLDRIARFSQAGSWVASGARGWLDFWQEDIGLNGFHPFDLLAGAYVLRPELFDCALVRAWIGHDDRLNNFWFFDPLALQVGLPTARSDDAISETMLTYCIRINPDSHAWLISELSNERVQMDISKAEKWLRCLGMDHACARST